MKTQQKACLCRWTLILVHQHSSHNLSRFCLLNRMVLHLLGRLDGLEIDASGTVRANYTNGQNNPLGKIVLANFNNQNWLRNRSVTRLMLRQLCRVTLRWVKLELKDLGPFCLVLFERSNVDVTEELVNLDYGSTKFSGVGEGD